MTSRNGVRLIALAVGLAACAGRTTAPGERPLPPGAEAWSLLGEPLTPPPLADSVRANRESRLAEARAAYEADPDDADAIIWLGRRTAYLGRYREAIAIYTEGLEKHPGDARLYRHRGHRFITTRRLDEAIRDLSRAAFLIEGTEDAVEPDGLPNSRNIPTSTLHFNVWYHLALAHYLKGEHEQALEAWRRALEVSRNPDSQVAARYWIYLTLKRLRQDAEAARILEPVAAEMDVIENHAYHGLLLLFKGDADPDSLRATTEDALQNATLGYGIGAWHLVNGRNGEADRIFRAVVAGREWAAFGHLAAEAELAHSDKLPRSYNLQFTPNRRAVGLSDSPPGSSLRDTSSPSA